LQDLYSVGVVLVQLISCDNANSPCYPTDDLLARFRRARVDTFTERFWGVREPNFIKLGEDIGRSFLHKKFVWKFG